MIAHAIAFDSLDQLRDLTLGRSARQSSDFRWPKSSPCKTMPLVFMTRGERVARSSRFYPGALQWRFFNSHFLDKSCRDTVFVCLLSITSTVKQSGAESRNCGLVTASFNASSRLMILFSLRQKNWTGVCHDW